MQQASRSINRLLQVVASIIGTLMSVGALFAALNTMYSAVAVRSTEIATLRALGFGSDAVVISVLSEALLLALLGAGIGALLACSLLNGNTVSTIGGIVGGSQLVYRLAVTPDLIFTTLSIACIVCLLGALLPAIRAASGPIIDTLRAG